MIFRIVSYGGGTNSCAMLVGLYERGIRPDAITFADTRGEKPHTYEHLKTMQEWCRRVVIHAIETLAAPMPQQKKDGSLEQECIRLGKLPAKAYGFSSCSDKWKLEAQRRYNKRFAAERGVDLSQIIRLIGFDADEYHRVERAKLTEHKRPVREEYPLYDWDWGRDECIAAIDRAGLPRPGKSACFFCPSAKKPEILELRARYPDLFRRAITMERRALAGEGPAPRTTSEGLGRYFSWEKWVNEVDSGSCDMSDAGIPDVDCGCYDGD